MLSKESKSVLRFFYSYPYEKALLELVGRKLTKKHSELCLKTARTAQKIWNKHEKDILDLFREMYRIEIWEKFIKSLCFVDFAQFFFKSYDHFF